MSTTAKFPRESLHDYSVLITGGGSGIGAGTAQYLAEQGAKVTISGRRGDKVDAVAATLGANVCAVSGDITVAADRQRMLDVAIDHGGQLDGLINNAGNMYRSAITDLDQAALTDIFQTNVIAAMLLTGQACAHLAQTKGAIVFLGSIHNRRAMPGVSPYAATKAAIESLTRSFAAELGDRGIRVNCVAPGAVFTEINQRAGLYTDDQARARLESMSNLHALGRIGTESEVAAAIAYFLTAPWTTGAVLDVDGGLGLGLTNA